MFAANHTQAKFLSTMEIAEIKTQLTLARVLQHYGLKPDKHLRLHCPFHDDKTPSLQVYYKTHTAYCFSSNCKTHGKSLDVIDFVLYKENCSKHEAIEKCKELLNGDVTAASPAEQLTRTAILTKQFTYFKNAVHNSKPAQDYLQSRALDYTKLDIGYNTGQFHHGTRKDEALIKSCVQVGLLSAQDRLSRTGEASYKPFAKYCLVFALRNQSNQVSGLYFRSTINDQDQRHFYLKDRQGLYPKYPAPQTQQLILTESIIDAATLLQIPTITEHYSVLALYGTNGLTEEHIQTIQALPHLTEITLWFNADAAGRAATNAHGQTLQALHPTVRITAVDLPDGEDINSLAQTHTDPQLFIDLFNSRTDVSFSIEKTTASTESDQPKLFIAPILENPPITAPVPLKKKKKESERTNKPTLPAPVPALDASHPLKLVYATDTARYTVQGGVARQADQLKVMLVIESNASGHKARNRVDLYEDKQVERLGKDVSERLGLRRDLLEADLYRLTDLLEAYRDEQVRERPEGTGLPTVVLSAKERTELEAFAKKPKLLKRLNELLGQAGIVGEERNRIFLLLIAISHKMPEPLHALIQGSSGSGKTRLLKQISDCMPPESVTKLTRLSDKVLYNFPEAYFINRLLCLEDIDGLPEEAEFAFRELQSNGELNSATSIKLDNGQITSGQKTVKGPIASLSCTTRGELYEDNMSRVFLIAVDESAQQTERIIEYQNRVAAGLLNRAEESKTKTFLQQVVRILNPYTVVNPFAGQVRLPPEAHKIRRLNELFQGFVKMVTVVNQYQRRKDEKGRLVTELEDVETAVHILFESIVLKVDELDGSLRQFFEQLKTWLRAGHKEGVEQASFTLRDIRQALKLSKTQTFRYAGDLLRLEYIRPCGGHANKGIRYRISYWDNYQALRAQIKQNLDQQLQALKVGTHRNATGTLEPA
jgi:DNA primase/energy-coupling factor transporter ATP-binding protein EcfA2